MAPGITPAQNRLNSCGIDAICESIADGVTMTKIAEKVGVSIGSLIAWIQGDPERSARAREARASSARMWDEKAEQRLDEAVDEFELKKARELAHHYRWRSSKIAPAEYGDRVSLEHSGEIATNQLSDEQIEARVKALAEQAGDSES